MAQRPPAPGGGRPHVVGCRLTNHEKAWIAAHRGANSDGQFLVYALQQLMAQTAAEERLEQMGETD